MYKGRLCVSAHNGSLSTDNINYKGNVNKLLGLNEMVARRKRSRESGHPTECKCCPLHKFALHPTQFCYHTATTFSAVNLTQDVLHSFSARRAYNFTRIMADIESLVKTKKIYIYFISRIYNIFFLTILSQFFRQ